MKKVIRIVLWIVVAAVFVGTFVYLYNNSKSHEPVYAIVCPSVNDIERSSLLTGKIEPRDEIEIKPQISGIIAEINVEPGDKVKAGDVIARIKVIPDESQLSAAENRVEVARKNRELARSKYERSKTLYDKKYISREEYEESRNADENAGIELASAIDALSIVRDGVSSTNAQQSNTLVRSTIDGLVLDVPVKVGTSVIQANTFNDGTTIAKVADMNDLIFRGKIDETEVGMITTGMPVVITIGALPDVRPDASIEYISPKALEENGANTFEIKAAVSMPDSVMLRAGYSANAAVILNAAKGVITVPESVIEFDGDETYVYVLVDSVPSQKFERTRIVTGIGDGINIQVKEGIDTIARLRGSEID
ncbi:MAG: efflux RND transporter periplasmic adaptor subunit [Muribaculaceae bacterium]|nr:efflux RND transporter periplasmic adaptor subunit [Muribaculaceae bacterium]